ncbi:hypothetical protein T261_06237 [Streptomyces lydicus]|nr:hypothetical protein T261_06237 [Streptomyces lydicus]
MYEAESGQPGHGWGLSSAEKSGGWPGPERAHVNLPPCPGRFSSLAGRFRGPARTAFGVRAGPPSLHPWA